MSEFISVLHDWLTQHPHWLLASLGLTALLESLALVGIVVPGVAIMFIIAGLAGSMNTSLLDALAFAWLGAVIGDGISFWLGRQVQGTLHLRWPFNRHQKLLQQGEDFFIRYGSASVILGRFIGPIRPVVPLIAGAMGMPFRRFALCATLSALAWSPAYVMPGYLVGKSMAMELQLPPHFYPVVLTALAILTLTGWLFVHFQLQLGLDGRIHRALQQRLKHYGATHQFWRLLSSQRPQGGEFPLPSLALFLVSLALFVLWSMLVAYTQLLAPLDQASASFFQILRNPLLDPFMLTLTLLGDERLLWMLFSLLVGLLAFRGHYAAALHVMVAGLATGLLTHGLKQYFQVPRPDLVAALPTSASYPSGHTSGTVVLMGLIASFIAGELASRQRWKAYLGMAPLMLLIALSRVYLGVHWLSDIIGGLLLGLSICGLTRVSFSRNDRSALNWNTTCLITLLAGILTATSYVYLNWDHALAAYSPIGRQ